MVNIECCIGAVCLIAGSIRESLTCLERRYLMIWHKMNELPSSDDDVLVKRDGLGTCMVASYCENIFGYGATWWTPYAIVDVQSGDRWAYIELPED
nr:MAG TPA: hypothetical protein [Bacteriophage sp.]